MKKYAWVGIVVVALSLLGCTMPWRFPDNIKGDSAERVDPAIKLIQNLNIWYGGPSPSNYDTDKSFFKSSTYFGGGIYFDIQGGTLSDMQHIHRLIDASLVSRFGRYSRLSTNGNYWFDEIRRMPHQVWIEYWYKFHNDGSDSIASVGLLTEPGQIPKVIVGLFCPKACEKELVTNLLEQKAVAPLSSDAAYNYGLMKKNIPK